MDTTIVIAFLMAFKHTNGPEKIDVPDGMGLCFPLGNWMTTRPGKRLQKAMENHRF